MTSDAAGPAAGPSWDPVLAASPLPLGQIRPRGWLERQLRLQADGITGRLPEVWADVGEDSGWLGGDGESWERGPYYLDGLLPLAHVLDDASLKEKVTPWIEWMLGSQRADGDVGPAGLTDWWPRMVAAKVLVQHAEATGDVRVAPFLLRWHRYQAEHLPHRPLEGWGRARGAEDVLNILWTHARTGEDWLLDLAQLVLAQTFDWDDYLTTRLIRGQAQLFTHSTHGVNVAMGLKAGAAAQLLAMARSRAGLPVPDGEKVDHRSRTEASFAALERWHGQAHGWFSGDEWLGGREATAGIETCLVTEMMHTQGVLSRIYGDSLQGDRLESLAVNLLPASSDPRMLGHQYHQQGTQVSVDVARRPWSYSSDDANVFGLEPHFGCCTANLHQGWPKLAASLWARDVDGGLRSVAHFPAQVSTTAGGAPVTIDVVTEYPAQETVAITVTGGSRFPLRLRVPTWCEAPQLRVDGVGIAVQATADGHVELDRDWTGTTRIELVLPMRPRIVRRERQAAAVHLGPMVMVASPGEIWTEIPDVPGLGEWHVHPRTTWNWALAEVEGAGEWPVHRAPLPDVPFELSGAVRISALGARVPGWELDGASAAPPPPSPVLDHGPTHRFDLVPYGVARLRVMEFPVIGQWDSAGNEDVF